MLWFIPLIGIVGGLMASLAAAERPVPEMQLALVSELVAVHAQIVWCVLQSEHARLLASGRRLIDVGLTRHFACSAAVVEALGRIDELVPPCLRS